MFSFQILLTIYAGFMHAFEADHLLAVSSIVYGRNSIKLSLKDGAFWGLGHALTLFFIGIVLIAFKAGISPKYFHYFEAAIGFLLIALAIYRLVKFFSNRKIIIHFHPHEHGGVLPQRLHIHGIKQNPQHAHSLAFGVGLLHGLAGSGALIVVIMAQIKGAAEGLIYLLLFGICCLGGMLLACGLFSIPFSKRMMKAQSLQAFLIISSSLLCLLYGGKVIYENLLP